MLVATVPFIALMGYRILRRLRVAARSHVGRTRAHGHGHGAERRARTGLVDRGAGDHRADHVGGKHRQQRVRGLAARQPALAPQLARRVPDLRRRPGAGRFGLPDVGKAADRRGFARNEPELRAACSTDRGRWSSNLVAARLRRSSPRRSRCRCCSRASWPTWSAPGSTCTAWQTLLQNSAPPVDGLLEPVRPRPSRGGAHPGAGAFRRPAVAAGGRRRRAGAQRRHRTAPARWRAHSLTAPGTPCRSAGWGVGVALPARPLDVAVRQVGRCWRSSAPPCACVLGLYLASRIARHLVEPLDQLSRGEVSRIGAPIRGARGGRSARGAGQRRRTRHGGAPADPGHRRRVRDAVHQQSDRRWRSRRTRSAASSPTTRRWKPCSARPTRVASW